VSLPADLPLPAKSETWTFTCWTEGDLRTHAIAAWNAALEAAIKAVEHEAFPSELPRFGVATDKLRDMRIEPEKPK